MRILLAFLILGFANKSICQTTNYSFTIQPDAISLLDSLEKKDILVSIDGFLKAKNNSIEANPYVQSSYLKINPQPFTWFVNIEQSDTYKDRDFYKPILLAVLPINESHQYLIKLSYVGITPEGKPLHKMTFSLILKKINNQYFFYDSLPYNTREWNKKHIGSIFYIYPNKLNLTKAKKMNECNKIFAKKFNYTVIPITYYKCYDPEQLFKIIGCDYISNMYFSISGGIAEQWHNTLFAGNNSELYLHEMVHFYTAKAFPDHNRIVDEGYATYIGGSGGQSLEKLAELVKQYLLQNQEANITQEFIEFKRIKWGIPFTYIISGIICKEIEAQQGFEKIKELYKSGLTPDEYFIQLEKITGISKDKFGDYVKKLLNKKMKLNNRS